MLYFIKDSYRNPFLGMIIPLSSDLEWYHTYTNGFVYAQRCIFFMYDLLTCEYSLGIAYLHTFADSSVFYIPVNTQPRLTEKYFIQEKIV